MQMVDWQDDTIFLHAFEIYVPWILKVLQIKSRAMVECELHDAIRAKDLDLALVPVRCILLSAHRKHS